MLRPTLAEVLTGIQNTILSTLLPELSSPYAQGQATIAAADLAQVSASLEKAPAYDAAEVADLEATLQSLKSPSAEGSSPDRRAMEAAISELAAALALGKLDASAAEKVRGYMRRHLERMRDLLKSPWGV